MLISEHHVRECAYYIWENEGRIHGQAAAHWIRAEAELRANAMLAAAATVVVAEAAPKARLGFCLRGIGLTPSASACRPGAARHIRFTL